MDPETIIVLSIAYLLVFIGLLINGFIVIANLFRWIKCGTLQTVDLLTTSLALVRLMILSIYMDKMCLVLFDWSPFHIDNPEFETIFTMCMTLCSFWWGSVLCVFYCVKISNHSNRLFLTLKMNISKRIPWLLLISLVISFLSSLPCRWVVFSNVINDTVNTNETMELKVYNLLLVTFAGSITPFIIFCVAIFLIIMSLLRHSRNISSRDSSFSNAQREIHLSIIRRMISFLLSYALHFISYTMFVLNLNFTIPIFSLISFLGMCAFPSLHSISFIVCNRELKNSIRVVFSCTWLETLNKQAP